MIGAGASVGATAGTRAYLATRHWSWLTRARLRAITVTLLVAALLGSAVSLKGSTAASSSGHRSSAASHVPALRAMRSR